jgi:hypothetical protein
MEFMDCKSTLKTGLAKINMIRPKIIAATSFHFAGAAILITALNRKRLVRRFAGGMNGNTFGKTKWTNNSAKATPNAEKTPISARILKSLIKRS